MLVGSAEVEPAAGIAAAQVHRGRIVVQAWIASRGLIAAVALIIAIVDQRRLAVLVSNWDVQHFVRLAEGGYLAQPHNALMAFFPGLPVLLSLSAQTGVPMAVGGVIISTLCSAAAAAALYRLGGPWAAVAWLFAPTAVFTTVPYTESLFCAAAFWAWERARSDRWLAAAVLASIACTVRVSGVFLVGALLVMIISDRTDWQVKIKRAGLMLIPAAVVVGFVSYLYLLTGSWSAWYQAQSTGWVRGLTWPWESFRNTIPAILPGAYADHPWWAAVFRGEMISMAVGLGVTLWCVVASIRARRSPRPGIAQGRGLWGEGSWVGVQVLAFSLSYWFFSVNRATLLWFPLWVLIGRWVGWQPTPRFGRIAHRSLVALSFATEIVLMTWWSWLYFTGHWAS
jgi:hypothetical protein